MIRLATWNLERLLLEDDAFERRLETIASFVDENLDKPDVLAVQELQRRPRQSLLEVPLDPHPEDPAPPVFERLRERLGYSSVGSFVGIAGNHGVRTALFSDHPACSFEGRPEVHRFAEIPGEARSSFSSAREPTPSTPSNVSRTTGCPGASDGEGSLPSPRFSRPPLLVSYALPTGPRLNVLCVHLKSQKPRLDFDRPLPSRHRRQETSDVDESARGALRSLVARTQEAVGVRVLTTRLLRRRPGDYFVLLGDLNDVPGSVTTDILCGRASASSGRDPVREPSTTARLSNLTALVPERERWSYIHRGRRVLLDHVLANAALARTLSHDGDGVGVRIHNSFLQGSLGSSSLPDHAPVVASFDLP